MKTIFCCAIICFNAVFAARAWGQDHKIADSNCADFADEKRPYQISMRRNNDADDVIIQVKRLPNLKRIQYSISNGVTQHSEFHGNYQTLAPGTKSQQIIFEYNVPLDKYFWQIATDNVQVTPSINGKKGAMFKERFQLLGQETVSVSRCNFSKMHYVMETHSASIKSTQEVWFSTELNTYLKIRSSFSSTDPTQPNRTTYLSAISITQDFKPLF